MSRTDAMSPNDRGARRGERHGHSSARPRHLGDPRAPNAHDGGVVLPRRTPCVPAAGRGQAQCCHWASSSSRVGGYRLLRKDVAVATTMDRFERGRVRQASVRRPRWASRTIDVHEDLGRPCSLNRRLGARSIGPRRSASTPTGLASAKQQATRDRRAATSMRCSLRPALPCRSRPPLLAPAPRESSDRTSCHSQPAGQGRPARATSTACVSTMPSDALLAPS